MAEEQKAAPLDEATKAAVVKQVDFYFSNSNIPNDKFLRGLVEATPEGWVSIETIASFKRMQQLSENLAGIVEALKSSKELDVSEDGKNVKRKEPFRSDYWEVANKQSIYAVCTLIIFFGALLCLFLVGFSFFLLLTFWHHGTNRKDSTLRPRHLTTSLSSCSRTWPRARRSCVFACAAHAQLKLSRDLLSWNLTRLKPPCDLLLW